MVFATTSTISYWDKQRKGANVFNASVTNELWQQASRANIELVRLAPDKWKGKQRDFLLGNADHFTGLVPEDLQRLKSVLADADKNGVKVVLTMLSLPGLRWKQLNNNRDDHRLWQEEIYQQQAIQFWRELALALRGNKAIVGYNIINEPHPEVTFGYQYLTAKDYPDYTKKVAGTLADLTIFYQKVVDAVREVDPHTPIILDVGMYADPRSFSYFQPVRGDNILYSFHMYEPYFYTNKKLNNGQYTYPGKLLIKSKSQPIYIDKYQLQSRYFRPIVAWQKRYQVPSSRIFAGEFGGNRATPGLQAYFSDLITIFNKQGWHWAFYSFREDTWDGMDYELGAKPLGAKYWEAVAKGEHPKVVRRPNPIWTELQRGLTQA